MEELERRGLVLLGDRRAEVRIISRCQSPGRAKCGYWFKLRVFVAAIFTFTAVRRLYWAFAAAS